MSLKNKKTAIKPISTKDQILIKAEGLFSKYNYYTVSMDQIAKLVNTTKAAIYYYFKSKRDLYLQVLANSFALFNNSLKIVLNGEEEAEKKLHNTIKTYIDFCINQREIIFLSMQKMSQKDSAIIKFASGLKSEIIDLLEPLVKEVLTETCPHCYAKRCGREGMEEGKKVISNIDTRLTTSLLADMMDSFAMRQNLEKNVKMNSAKVADQIMELFFLKNISSEKKREKT